MQTYAYGFPRLGRKREYKKAIEGFWSEEINENIFRFRIQELEAERLAIYKRYVDKFPAGEMTFYDNMLDTAIMAGLYNSCILEEKETGSINLKEYYRLCRGRNALKLTKWFNTNYHYLVPEFTDSFSKAVFKVMWNKPKEYINFHKAGIPYLIGPFTFLKLSGYTNPGKITEYVMPLADIYIDLIKDFGEVHIDEPALVMELSREEISVVKDMYYRLGGRNPHIKLFTYYDSVDFLEELYDLPIEGIGLDFINGRENLAGIKRYGFPKDKILIAGIVNGRNIWRTDINKTVEFLRELSLYAENLIISNAGPLYHLPITIKNEQLDERLLKKIAFAKERLEELKLISEVYAGLNKEKRHLPESNNFGINPAVQKRVNALKEGNFKKLMPYEQRIKEQKKVLDLPLFPLTTIGSFPQTLELRKKRRDFREGNIPMEKYKSFIKKEIAKLIKFQERFGMDVLVHGEFERTDMVEFFAQELEGITPTKKGWIISYGTRVYRPPIIYGDIWRQNSMTLEEISFAQGLTKKPVKGMLTGPVTIIAWSFLREDIPVWETAYQIALCLQDEIKDYEKEGIKIVQIDEPAFKEKAPLKKKDWPAYFEWAVKAFNLASQSMPRTQIHTHMCYSDFSGIIDEINKMDFDVITIETARGKGSIIENFKNGSFKKQIGLGIWDIHSPLPPAVNDMENIVNHAVQYLPAKRLWINPDCGLKTRKWEEVNKALEIITAYVRRLRKKQKAVDCQRLS